VATEEEHYKSVVTIDGGHRIYRNFPNNAYQLHSRHCY